MYGFAPASFPAVSLKYKACLSMKWSQKIDIMVLEICSYFGIWLGIYKLQALKVYTSSFNLHLFLFSLT